MRKIFAFLIVFSVFSAAFADNIDGYYKMKFGMDEVEVKNIIKDLGFYLDGKEILDDDFIMITFMPAENFTIFFEKVFSINCTFYHKKLIAVTISFIDVNNHKELFKYFLNKYKDLELHSKNDEKNEMKFIDKTNGNCLRVSLFEDNSHLCFIFDFMLSNKNPIFYTE